MNAIIMETFYKWDWKEAAYRDIECADHKVHAFDSVVLF